MVPSARLKLQPVSPLDQARTCPARVAEQSGSVTLDLTASSHRVASARRQAAGGSGSLSSHLGIGAADTTEPDRPCSFAVL